MRRNPNNGGKHRLLDVRDAALEKALGRPLPAEVHPATEYAGEPQIIVTTVRTALAKDEPLKLTVIVLDREQPKTVRLQWRTIGEESFRTVELKSRGRAVYEAELPAMDGWGRST